jgi:hypothetical protein
MSARRVLRVMVGLALGYAIGRILRGARAHRLARGPMTQALVRVNPADTPIGPPGRNLDQRLDEAVKETFPASDPIAVHIE